MAVMNIKNNVPANECRRVTVKACMDTMLASRKLKVRTLSVS